MNAFQAKLPQRPRVLWLMLLTVVPTVSAGAHLLQALGPAPLAPLELELAAYGNTLLTVSAVLYLLRPVSRSQWLAPWASGLALAGAIELVWGALVAWPDADALLPGWDWWRDAALLTAVALIAYLVIEAFYRDRRTGAFVVPLIALASVFQVQWLGVALRVPGEELVRLHGLFSVICAAVLGYLLLAAGAALAAAYLLAVRAAGETPGNYVRGTSGQAVLNRAVRMVQANVWGVVVLGAACVGWEWWAYGLPRESLFLSPVEPWALVVLAAYLGHLFLLWFLRPAPRCSAGWATILFGCSSLPLAAMLMASAWVLP